MGGSSESVEVSFAVMPIKLCILLKKGSVCRAGYKGQVDYFAVYSHKLGKVYLLPVNEVSQT